MKRGRWGSILMRLDDQIVVVTGASRGLGRAIALAMAEEGAHVILAARDRPALDAVARTIAGIGGSARVMRCDVRDPGEVKALGERVLADFGRVDTLVNSAGVALRSPLVETKPEQWDELFDVLVRGTMLMTQALLPAMIARRRGNIINLAAPLDLIETPGFAAYAAAKNAVAGLTRTLANELRPYGINVNGLHPGGFADTATMRGVMSAPGGPGFPAHLLDPSIITPAALALAAQPGYGLSGDSIDAVAWNTDSGLGAGLG